MQLPVESEVHKLLLEAPQGCGIDDSSSW